MDVDPATTQAVACRRLTGAAATTLDSVLDAGGSRENAAQKIVGATLHKQEKGRCSLQLRR